MNNCNSYNYYIHNFDKDIGIDLRINKYTPQQEYFCMYILLHNRNTCRKIGKYYNFGKYCNYKNNCKIGNRNYKSMFDNYKSN